MPSTEEREAQPVLESPCPRCGSGVVIRNWKGQFYAKCTSLRCTFEFDTDNRGQASAHCAACGTGRLRTQARGRVCADCGKPEGAAPPTARKEPAASQPDLGPCPKCQAGSLAVRTGTYGTFVSCSARCGLTYSSDEQGVPEGGTCKSCQGPVKKTQSGSRVCALCGTWQEEKAAAPRRPEPVAPAGQPPKPKAAKCPRCSQPMREVFTRRQKWAYRCDPCQAWFDA